MENRERKMGGMLPTKWEIVAQWFGQNGSHALRAEHCQREVRGHRVESLVEFRSDVPELNGVQIRVGGWVGSLLHNSMF